MLALLLYCLDSATEGRKLSRLFFFPFGSIAAVVIVRLRCSCSRSGGREHPSQWASKQAAALGNSPFMRGSKETYQNVPHMANAFPPFQNEPISDMERSVHSSLVYIGIQDENGKGTIYHFEVFSKQLFLRSKC